MIPVLSSNLLDYLWAGSVIALTWIAIVVAAVGSSVDVADVAGIVGGSFAIATEIAG